MRRCILSLIIVLSICQRRAIFLPKSETASQKYRGGEETANFLEKFGKMLAFFSCGGKTGRAKTQPICIFGKMGGFGTGADAGMRGVETRWVAADISRCVASLRYGMSEGPGRERISGRGVLDAMHRVSTGGIRDGISEGSGRRRIPGRGV